MAGLLSRTSSDMQRGSASRFALRSLFAFCGIFRREAPSRPRIPCVYGLEVGGRRRTWSIGVRVPSLFRALRERRVALGWVGNVVVAATDPRHKLPSAYLRERLLVLHLQLLFQGGAEFPTGGKSGGAKGVRGAGEASAPEPMSPRPVCALVRMPAELVRSQYQRLESG